MTKWARLETKTKKWPDQESGDPKQTAMEIIAFDPTGKFHPDLTWQECPDDTVEWMIYEGGEFLEHDWSE